jgi:AraC family transcriptional regulator, regulatory protein of adaptative response / methylated-DNA-[protein]-cysteine methyltransferase
MCSGGKVFPLLTKGVRNMMTSSQSSSTLNSVTHSAETEMWNAVEAKDRSADGRFVFAVKSTGIFCRPSCPSRRPRRENVKFFAVPEAAESAGFRACLRCRPKEARAADPQLELVRKVCELIVTSDLETLSLEMLAEQVGGSPYHLQRTFKKILGVSPKEYADSLRLNNFKTRIKEGASVTTALYDAGFGSSSRLYEKSNETLGMTPSEYGQGGPGIEIDYTVVDSPLGKLLVAATAKGVCSVTLGDSAEELQKTLVREFPAAETSASNSQLQRWADSIVKHLSGRLPHLDLPFDVRATAFQRQVWDTLRRIPYGTTRSYSEVAREIGRPSAVRAVARACATNPVALVVPCHRVIREDGELGGYRWGVERKKQLLAREKEQTRKG